MPPTEMKVIFNLFPRRAPPAYVRLPSRTPLSSTPLPPAAPWMPLAPHVNPSLCPGRGSAGLRALFGGVLNDNSLGVGPEPLDVVIGPYWREEDVRHHVVIVHERPPALLR